MSNRLQNHTRERDNSVEGWKLRAALGTVGLLGVAGTIAAGVGFYEQNHNNDADPAAPLVGSELFHTSDNDTYNPDKDVCVIAEKLGEGRDVDVDPASCIAASSGLRDLPGGTPVRVELGWSGEVTTIPLYHEGIESASTSENP